VFEIVNVMAQIAKKEDFDVEFAILRVLLMIYSYGNPSTLTEMTLFGQLFIYKWKENLEMCFIYFYVNGKYMEV
jgi:hypothetical protein